jgi:hypothetical protein
MGVNRRASLAGLVVAGCLSLPPAFAASPAPLVPHRAVYDLQLADAEERSGISGVYGRMVYEMRGSACDGYTVNFRFLTRIDTEEFSRITDQQASTYEDIDAGTFRFLNRSYVDEVLDREVSGVARHGEGGVVVELTEPAEMRLTLDPAKFPTEHMVEMIEKAKAGERFYQSHIFDGSEDADQVLLTTTVIGEEETPPKNRGEGEGDIEAAGPIADEPYWPVTVAYFSELDVGDQTPQYQVSFKLYDNGVTRDMVMDYGDFALAGELVGLELFETPECDS